MFTKWYMRVTFWFQEDMVCLSCTATGERVCLAAEGFGNRHCFLENIADKVGLYLIWLNLTLSDLVYIIMYVLITLNLMRNINNDVRINLDEETELRSTILIKNRFLKKKIFRSKRVTNFSPWSIWIDYLEWLTVIHHHKKFKKKIIFKVISN